MTHERAENPLQAPLGSLERSLIDGYLRARGFDPGHLDELDAATRDGLLREASVYASARLAEVEARSHYVRDIHEGGPDVSKTGLE
jgi:hypothetical protein